VVDFGGVAASLKGPLAASLVSTILTSSQHHSEACHAEEKAEFHKTPNTAFLKRRVLILTAAVSKAISETK
jgi:hypothetical protein